MADLQSFMQSFGETLIENGYPILPIIPGKKIPGAFTEGEWRPENEWQRHCDRPTRAFEYDIWRRWPGCAIGIACGAVVGIDIDVLDADVAHAIEAMTRKMLGDTPAHRIGLAPKRMLIYRADVPFNGRKRHPLELLARGNQFVAYALHEKTGQPYAWPNESLTELDISQLPVITETQGLAWLDAAYDMVPEALRPKTISSLSKKNDVSTWAGPSDPRGTYDAIKSALDFIPNNDLDGTSWVMMLNAIKGSLGEEGRDLWLDWSHSSAKSGASGKSDTAERRWKSARPTKIGAGTIYYLAEQRGWVPESHLILNAASQEAAAAPHPAAGLIAKARALIRVAPPSRRTDARHPPAFVMDNLEGVLADFVSFNRYASASPQPFLALGAGLCAVGAAAGRRYRGPTGFATNLMVVALAGSAGGKDHPKTMVSEAFRTAGLSKYIGGGKIASGSGLLSALQAHPVKVFALDEFGHVMAQNSGKNAATHKSEILSLFTELFTTSNGTYGGTEYGDKKLNPLQVIEQPCLVVFGVTVPGTFWRALQSANMGDGSLARYLIFQSPVDYPDLNRGLRLHPLPDKITDAIKQIAAGVPGHDYGGDLAAIMGANQRMGAYEVPYGNGAEAAFEAVRDDQLEWSRKSVGTSDEPSIGRFAEHTLRLATINAISRAPSSPVITVKDMAWGRALAEHCILTTVRETDRFVSDNQTQADHKKVLDIIRQSGGISGGELGKRTQFLRAKERGEILSALLESQLIVANKRDGSGAGRPSVTYAAVDAEE